MKQQPPAIRISIFNNINTLPFRTSLLSAIVIFLTTSTTALGVSITLGSANYETTSFWGVFNQHPDLQNNPWWGSAESARSAANQVGSNLYDSTRLGPAKFADALDANTDIVSYVYWHEVAPHNGTRNTGRWSSENWAIATPLSSVPDTGNSLSTLALGLTIFSSFRLYRVPRNRLNRPAKS